MKKMLVISLLFALLGCKKETKELYKFENSKWFKVHPGIATIDPYDPYNSKKYIYVSSQVYFSTAKRFSVDSVYNGTVKVSGQIIKNLSVPKKSSVNIDFYSYKDTMNFSNLTLFIKVDDKSYTVSEHFTKEPDVYLQ